MICNQQRILRSQQTTARLKIPLVLLLFCLFAINSDINTTHNHRLTTHNFYAVAALETSSLALNNNNHNNSNKSQKMIQKTVREICRKPPKHWVGNGFHVYPGKLLEFSYLFLHLNSHKY